MSSPSPYKEAVADEMEAVGNWEKLKNFEELLSKTESSFITFMNEVLRKYSNCVVDSLKVLLECPICKELIIEAVTRKCHHTFCNHCMMEWFKRSTDCPICRNGVSRVAKNSSIDGVINLLVEISFTKEEKNERDQRMQLRSSAVIQPKDDDDGSSTAITSLRAVAKNELTRREKILVTIGRTECLVKAQELYQEMFTTTDLGNELSDEEDCQPFFDFLHSFSNDFNTLRPALKVVMENF